MLAQMQSSSALHNWWGSSPDAGSGPGAMATQSVSITLRLTHAGDILYAPTIKPADHSCIEVATVHTTGTPQVWAWDWCHTRKEPAATVNITSSFLSTYAKTVNGRSAYTVKDVRTSTPNNTWTAYLYNYRTKAWDKLWTSSGTDHSGHSFGWDMFEFYSSINPADGHTYVCDDLQRTGMKIESSSLEIYSGGTWNPATAADSAWIPVAHPSPSGYKCPNIKFNIITADSDWVVDVA